MKPKKERSKSRNYYQVKRPRLDPVKPEDKTYFEDMEED